MPTAEQVATLGTAAAELLDACVRSLSTIGEAPTAYLYPGVPPVDVGEEPCEGMLAVYCQTLGRTPLQMGRAGLSGLNEEGIVRVPQVELMVVYASCVDVWGDYAGDVPPADRLSAAGASHMQAGWALMNGIHHAVQRGELFSRCRTWNLGQLTPLAVSGQTAGWSFPVTLQLDGYDPYE